MSEGKANLKVRGGTFRSGILPPGQSPRTLRPVRPRGRRHSMRSIATATALLLLTTLAGPARGEPPELTVEDDRVTASIREAPVEDVIAAFARETGALVRGGVQNPRTVTLELDKVPVQAALERVLGDQNFALVYRTDGSVKVLRLLGAATELTVPAATTNTTVPGLPTAAGFLTRTIQVPADGRLRGVVGSDSATLQQILDIAVHNEDLSLRVEALQAGITGIESDPELKDAATTGLERLSDETLESLIRGVAGDRARELVAQVGARSRVSAVRSRAYRLLRRLVPQAAPGAPNG